MSLFVAADPYDFPYDGDLSSENTIVMVIDMQRDFCDRGGCFDSMGYDVTPMRALIEPIAKVLEAARSAGYPIIHTRQGKRADLADVPDVVRWRSRNGGAEIGAAGPLGRYMIRGEEGFQIVDELSPLPGEPVVDKAGASAFYATDLDLLLRSLGTRNIVFTGITTDVCVHSTMRAAADRGFDGLLLEDCCAATVPSNHLAALSMIKQEGGYFGCVANATEFIRAISRDAETERMAG